MIARANRPLLALAWMSLSAVGFSGMAVFVKLLGPRFPFFELVFFRSIINLLAVAPMVMRNRKAALRPPKGTLKLLIFRGIAGFCGVSSLFYSIQHLPLPIAMMIGWTSPIFVILFSRFFLGETVRPLGLAAIGVSFLGLLFLLNPWNNLNQGTALSPLAVGVGLAGAAAAGLAYVSVRAATAHVGAEVIVLYFMLVATVISTPLALWDFKIPQGSQTLALLGLGLFATLGQVAMTRGYLHAPASYVSAMSLLNAALSALSGWILFQETLSWMQWFGLLTVAGGIFAMTWLNRPVVPLDDGGSR